MKVMKSFIIGLLVLCLYKESDSQTILNADFESWDTANIPVNWTLMSNGVAIGQSTESYSGIYAAVIWKWYFYGNQILLNGSLTSFGPAQIIKAGTPISFKPIQLSGFYKYQDVAPLGDSAKVIVLLKKYDTVQNKIDTVGYGMKLLGPVNAYSPFQVDITDVQPSVTPDSIVIAFFASATYNDCDYNGSGNCSYLYIDELSLDTVVGIPDTGKKNKLLLYPNPTTGTFTLSVGKSQLVIDNKLRIYIYNILGELIYQSKISNPQSEIKIAKQPKGIYFVKVINRDILFGKKIIYQ